MFINNNNNNQTYTIPEHRESLAQSPLRLENKIQTDQKNNTTNKTNDRMSEMRTKKKKKIVVNCFSLLSQLNLYKSFSECEEHRSELESREKTKSNVCFFLVGPKGVWTTHSNTHKPHTLRAVTHYIRSHTRNIKSCKHTHMTWTLRRAKVYITFIRSFDVFG